MTIFSRTPFSRTPRDVRFLNILLHILVFPSVLALLFLLLTGCNHSLESLDVTVQGDQGELPLKLRDLGRRPTGEEALVGPLEEGDRPFRYRIEAAGDEPLFVADPDPRLTVTVSGDITGGEILLFAGDEGLRYSFSGVLTDKRSLGDDGSPRRYRLSFPLASLRSGPWEVEFRAPRGSRGYRVEELLFGSKAPKITLGEVLEADMLLPLVADDEALVLPVTTRLVRDHTHSLEIRYRAEEKLFLDRRDRPRLNLLLEGSDGESRTVQVQLRPGERQIVLWPQRWLPRAESLTIPLLDGVVLKEIRHHSLPENPREPILIDLEELQRWPRELWRRDDFELFSWSAYPRILWMDHRSYQTQARMFRRLAFFVEKRGYQGRLLSNQELEDLHGWNAHNYRPEGLADFFNAAEASGFELNSEELVLRDIAHEQGLLIRQSSGDAPAGERWLPGTGGVLSISQESVSPLRRLLTVHEAMHGVFYEEPEFRRAAYDYWDHRLSRRERDFWQTFFSWMSYDPDDRYLMVNEFQAYLLQQGERSANWYFGTRIAERIRRALPNRAAAIDAIIRDYPRTFIDAAAAINEALFSASGMVGGDPFCLLPGEE
ncbi:hypothetical protein SAMN05920897_10524 [Alkalispirochaeta americana]|uniref:Uncharacterized protein n=1 Tax=Alkalispirochaeta americana TaxID=159291 RepID=A0A1N6QRU3_9SPIO|nr:hypothetical protein [Alkalispirochaeta americana]SIQ19212.1 hypothetical protein SAMN05920897_10524 [Alkalispirochaeta americana]